MIRHTPGPWEIEGRTVYALMHAGWRKGVEEFKNRFWVGVYGAPECSEEEKEANARLIAEAPAMALALSLIACGAARIERSPYGRLEEFCFDGIRYCMNGDWNALFEVIGWDKARAALPSAEGGAA